jgi:hypothetical protein
MSEKARHRGRATAPRSLSAAEREEYDLLVRLERLESLLEELEELGVATRAEAEAAVRELHARLDSQA